MQNRLLDQVRSFLQQRNVEGYLVGGYVRDLVSGRPTNDIDIAVMGKAIPLARRLADAIGGHFVLLDPQNDIARVVAGNGNIYVDVSSLRGNDLPTDLAARDFTFNALAIPLAAADPKQITDLFGGLSDLRAKTVRAVSDRAFRDDPLRLVRAVRFAVQFGYSIEPHTYSLIQRDAGLLANVAAERVRDELVRILSAPGAWSNLHLLDDLHLLAVILPEVDDLRGVSQPPQHYYDVFTHTLAVVDAVEETLIACRVADIGKRPPGPPHAPLPVGVLGQVAENVRPHLAEVISADRSRLLTLKLAALFHDIAKPRTRTVDEQGKVHFYNHPQEGGAMSEQAMRRLRFSLREIHIVKTMVLNHMRPAQIAADPQATPKAIYRYFRDTGREGIDTLFLSLADHIGTRGPRLDPAGWWQHAQFTRLLLEYYVTQPEKNTPLPRLITGHDVMKAFKIPPGPRVGELLEEVREAQAVGEIHTREEALELVAERLKEKEA